MAELRDLRSLEAGRELATRLPAALRQLDGALLSARGVADGGWEV